MSEERLAGHETVASDAVIAACVELMQESRDRKSSEYDTDYWIRLW